MLEVINDCPFEFAEQSIWNTSGNNYFVNGKKIPFSVKNIISVKNADDIRELLMKYEEENKKYVD